MFDPLPPRPWNELCWLSDVNGDEFTNSRDAPVGGRDPAAGWQWYTAIPLAILAVAGIGLLQGLIITLFHVPSFIVTLAGMLVCRAVTLTILCNQGIGPFPDAVRTLSTGFLSGFLGNIGRALMGY